MGARRFAAIALATMVALSAYGTFVPSSLRCGLPGSVGCPGGVLGPAVAAAGTGVQWFDVVMYDWGFWIVDSTTGANETNAWNVFEGWTVHINATSQSPTLSIGGTAYHGLGVEINATGQQLLSLAAPVGRWVSASFVAPNAEYHHQHLWCTIECGPGHGGQQAWVLNVIPPSILPLAHASSSTARGPAPLNVTFAGNATLGTPPYNYSWNFGDGTPSVYGSSVAHAFALGGVYFAVLTVTDAKGYQGSSTVTETVLSGAPLSASVSARAGVGVAPSPVSFAAQVHGGTPPYNYTWDYGDGPAQAGANATSHVYWSPGLFATLVTVTDASGARVSAITTDTVRPSNGSLTATLNTTTITGSAPFVGVFTAVGAGGVGPYSYLWDLGDGAIASGTNVTHTYNASGSYEVRVFVEDPAGAVGEASRLVSVTAAVTGGGGGTDDGGGVDLAPAVIPAAATPSQLHLVLTPSSGPAPLVVSASVSVVGGSGVNASASWLFGDGTSGTGLAVGHTFTTQGSYTVTVTTHDSSGASVTASAAVIVGGVSVRLVANTTLGDAPFSLLTAASVTGGSGSYGPLHWVWGDGSSTIANVTTHSYGAAVTGNVTIRASVVDSAAVAGNGTTTVTIQTMPTATLVVSLPSTGGLPMTVSFTLTVRGGTGHYAPLAQWIYGDGTSARAAPGSSHTFTSFGHFLVNVSTNDSYGRSVNATAWVNLSLNMTLPKGTAPTWSLTGVPDPSNASLALLGMVGLTGLVFLYRRRGKGGARSAAATRSAAALAPRTPPPPGVP